MINLLLDLWSELRLFWVQRPWNRPRKGFNPARALSDMDARKLRAGLILTRAL